VLLLGLSIVAAEPPPAPLTAPPEAIGKNIRQWIEQLGDVSYPQRRAARRELILIGPETVPYLQQARSSEDHETAVRAQEIIDTFRDMMLAGARVTLEFDPPRVRWDEAATLVVNIDNRSPIPCETPFAPGSARAAQESDAAQVGAMHDLADFLVVRGPDAEEIMLTTDLITEDPLVERAVTLRAQTTQAESLPPGATSTYRLREYNRGWARYRMLSAGTYEVQVHYQPQWADEELSRRHAGLVQSNVARLEVLNDAPAPVRHDHTYLHADVQREGDELIAYVTNAHDRPIHVNVSWGFQPHLHAQIVWQANWPSQEDPDRDAADEDAREVLEATWKPPAESGFRLDRIRRLAPGERCEIARVALDELDHARGARLPDRGNVHWRFRYTNRLSRAAVVDGTLDAVDVPAPIRALLSDLPVGMFRGAVASQPIPVARPR
jgi:hypothetical protein